MIDKEKLNLKLAIQNSVCSFSISGSTEDILKITERAQKEGALSTRILNVSVPYHSFFLKDTAKGFTEFVHQMQFRSPKMPIVSLIDQEILLDETCI